ncbi:NYN domain-containing protein [Nocardia aurea]|uniref:NYN domain-containing protein n=1 Tax=Nocardia aurea TaxID=2144174 RepID=UPI0033AA7F6D
MPELSPGGPGHDGGSTDRLVVVDAANVVGSRPDGWWRDRAGAARRLLERSSEFAARTRPPVELVVVLEGAAKAAAATEFDDVRVVLAEGSGDDTIVAVVAAAVPGRERDILVVTADRELRRRVEALGAETAGPRWLLDRLDP